MKDKEPKNNKEEWHGYQEWYDSYGTMVLRGNSKNDMDVGYQEYHGLKQTDFHIR